MWTNRKWSGKRGNGLPIDVYLFPCSSSHSLLWLKCLLQGECALIFAITLRQTESLWFSNSFFLHLKLNVSQEKHLLITSYLSRRSRRHLEDDTTANFIHIFGETVAKTNFSGWSKCLCCDKWELSWETQHSPQVPVTAAAYTSASPLRAAFSRTDPDCLWLAALNVGDHVTLSKKK